MQLKIFLIAIIIFVTSTILLLTGTIVPFLLVIKSFLMFLLNFAFFIVLLWGCGQGALWLLAKFGRKKKVLKKRKRIIISPNPL